MINLWTLAPYLIHAPASVSAGESEPSFRLISFNVLRTNEEVESTLERIVAEDADFVYLMEVHGQWKEPLENLKTKYPHQKIVSRQTYVGVAFLSKHPWNDLSVYNMGEIANPTIDATFQFGSAKNPLRIIGTHPVPPFGSRLTTARDRQLVELAEKFDQDQANLLVGDFNISPWSPRFSPILTAGSLRDASKGFSMSPTLAPMPTLFGGLKVDHILCNEKVAGRNFELQPNSGSDHHMLIFDFSLAD